MFRISKRTSLFYAILLTLYIVFYVLHSRDRLNSVALNISDEKSSVVKSQLSKFEVFAMNENRIEECDYKSLITSGDILATNFTIPVSCSSIELYIEFHNVSVETPGIILETLIEGMQKFMLWPGITGISFEESYIKFFPRSDNLVENILEINEVNIFENRSCLSQAKKLSERYGFVQIQIFNEAFVNTTKSFICNLRKFDNILINTLFIATDRKAFSAINEFGHSEYYTCIEDYSNIDTLIYGQKQYFKFILWRSNFLLDLLKNNVTFFLTESDSIWLDNFYPHLFKAIETHPEALVFLGNNRPTRGKHLNGGFQYIKSDPLTIQVWEALINWQNKNTVNEQFQLDKLYYKFIRNQTVFFGDKVVISGNWFQRRVLRSTSNVVILNNWIKGITQKIERFKSWGFWFFDETSNECSSPKPLKDFSFIEEMCNRELC